MRQVRRVLPRVCVQLLSAALFIACVTPSAQAQTVTLNRDYDLVVDNGLVHYSQTDGRWAYFTMHDDPTIAIGQCGCLLSAFATVWRTMPSSSPAGTTTFTPTGFSTP